ncbi:MAG: hypothetical protein JWM72_884 [Actinomycetia bacterium]|jgi:uncharacterized protein (DUF2252 family)|nr:hypothetical protein [Actinomycetes bacterium]
MSPSPFAFFRGAAAVMAADLAPGPRSGLTVQLCGDAHLSNFGTYASPERQLVFDVNDFDETIAGPFEWDLKRLVASLRIEAEQKEFDDAACEMIARRTAEEYRTSIGRLAEMRTLDVWYSYLTPENLRRLEEIANDKRAQLQIERYADKARSRDNLQALSKLAEKVDGRYRIRSEPPLLVPMRDVGAQNRPDELTAMAWDDFGSFKASLGDDHRHLLERFEPVDLAIKVVGVGSVGTRCFVVLLQGRDAEDPLFLQVKEANRSVLEQHVEPSPYDNQGQRVVEGQRLMQATSDIFLGWSRDTEAPDFYWRQLRDWKGSSHVVLDDPLDLERYGRLCAATLARAHARSGDAIAIAAYLGRSDRFDRALAEFAAKYAVQNLADFRGFTAAMKAVAAPG